MFLFFSPSLMFHGFISDFMFGPSVSPPADGFGLNKFSLVSVCLQRSWWWTKPWSWSLWEEFMAGTSSRLRSSASRWRCSRSSRRKTSSWSSSKTRILSEIPPGFRLFKRSCRSAGPAAGRPDPPRVHEPQRKRFLSVSSDTSVCWEPCTWGWPAPPWTATSTWSRSTTTTGRSRVRTGTEVSWWRSTGTGTERNSGKRQEAQKIL